MNRATIITIMQNIIDLIETNNYDSNLEVDKVSWNYIPVDFDPETDILLTRVDSGYWDHYGKITSDVIKNINSDIIRIDMETPTELCFFLKNDDILEFDLEELNIPTELWIRLRNSYDKLIRF